MILSDRDIKRCLQEGRLKIDPSPDLSKQLGPCSVDLRLGNEFCVFEHSKHPYINLRSGCSIEDIMKRVRIEDNEDFIMQPGDFVLATTIETLQIPDDLVGHIDGRSTLGRLGLIIHGTASKFDPGWHGKATLELSNIGRMPLALYPGMRICAFTFELLSSPAEMPYDKNPRSKYVKQDTVEPGKLSPEDL
ncbi:Deoxycytidine triphosphate deaminase [Candidatus Magnetobacterium bavaricum]|uniref:dCTP deaminase n=1 Tax=Candidatus Magnetobacterium bavaricum TaxID=29290 RepID=A0A0F3GK61_9BACT|nr:Deoxycytidine triphosphate deaminase [Candidatus Magnetobacterium bavaricum]